MPDPVRAALEKTVRRRVAGRRPDETAWVDAMADSADTIAAFLRALPAPRPEAGRMVPFPPGASRMGDGYTEPYRFFWDAIALAAAVERAAKETPPDAR